MNIDIKTLKSGLKDYISIEEELIVDKENFKNTDLLDLKNVTVKGTIKNSYDDYYLDLKVEGVMILPCALTLVPTEYKFSFLIEGDYQELTEDIENTKKYENTLDIFPILWENILMEIPMRVVNENAEPLTKGDGWSIITGEEHLKNSQFDKLNELLERKEV